MCCFCMKRRTNKGFTIAFGVALAIGGVVIAVLGANVYLKNDWIKGLNSLETSGTLTKIPDFF